MPGYVLSCCSTADVTREWRSDRGENRRLIEAHERLSAERFDAIKTELGHIQSVVNDIEDDTKSNATGIAVLKDRRDK